MYRKPVKNIIVLGGGTAGWLAAGYISSQLPDVTITVIESDKTKIVGVGETTVPQFRTHLEKMGLQESQWMKASGSTFKYGARFDGWRTGSDSRWHGFGDFLGEKSILKSTGEINKASAFRETDHAIDCDYWFKLLQQNKISESQLNWFNSEAYYLIKHSRAHALMDGTQVANRCPGYAYNINAFKVGQAIKDLVAMPNGVVHKVAHIDQVVYAEDQSVDYLVDSNGQKHTADLYIDCTGFRRLLIGEHSKWISFSDRLGCQNAIGGRVQYNDDQETACDPVLHTTAMSAGWSWRVPLRDDTGSGCVFDSRFIDPDDAEQELINLWNSRGKEIDIKVRIKYDNGILDRSAHRNVVAVGLASNFLEPLEATSISFTTLANELIVQLIQKHNGHWGHRDSETLSRLMRREIDYTTDFIWLHYALTQRTDTEFWRHVGQHREQALQLAYRWYLDDVDIHRREKDFDHTRYNKFDWAQMLTSQCAYHNVPTHPVDSRFLERALIQYQYRDTVGQWMTNTLPSHWQYLSQINNS